MTDEPTLADALLPCPFCGCDDIGRIDGPVEDDWVSFACRRCHTTGPHDYSDRHAIAAWNRRAALDRSEARVATLEGALKDVIGMLDDPTGGEHVRDMRGATLIARAALADKGGE